MTTPRRSLSTSGVPASAHASRAAIMANCSERSRRRISTRSITSLGSTATRAANFTVETSVHSSSRRRAPLLPASRAAQVDGTSPPRGVVAPRPVTTTRVLLLICIGLLCSAYDEVNGISDGAHLCNFLIRNLYAELLFCSHNNFNHAE